MRRIPIPSPKTWAAAAEDWECACCRRRKRDIVRMGKKGRWSGGVRSLRVLVDETAPDSIARRKRLFPGYRNEFWVGDAYSVEVCPDCSDVSRDARQRDRSAPDGHLRLKDIRDALARLSGDKRDLIWQCEAIGTGNIKAALRAGSTPPGDRTGNKYLNYVG